MASELRGGEIEIQAALSRKASAAASRAARTAIISRSNAKNVAGIKEMAESALPLGGGGGLDEVAARPQ